MARSTPTTQKVTGTGLVASYTAPNSDGDIIDPGATLLHVKNASGSSITVTAVTTATVSGLAVSNLTSTVGAGAEKFLGPFPKSTFGQAADAAEGPSQVLVNYSAVTSVTRAVISL